MAGIPAAEEPRALIQICLERERKLFPQTSVSFGSGPSRKEGEKSNISSRKQAFASACTPLAVQVPLVHEPALLIRRRYKKKKKNELMALTQSEHSEPEGAEKKRERPPCVASHHTCPHVMWLLSSPRNAASAPA